MSSDGTLEPLPWLPGIDESVAHTAGLFASVCFFLQYVPQMVLNARRQSTRGFSAAGIVLKLVGAAFLLVNAWITGEAVTVILYGLSNVLQHSIFMLQFWLYSANSRDGPGPGGVELSSSSSMTTAMLLPGGSLSSSSGAGGSSSSAGNSSNSSGSSGLLLGGAVLLSSSGSVGGGGGGGGGSSQHHLHHQALSLDESGGATIKGHPVGAAGARGVTGGLVGLLVSAAGCGSCGPERYLYWLLFPIVPFLIATTFPASIAVTNGIKPLTQVMSHLPQLRVCYQLRTTAGVSLTSQHLNIAGGVAGLFMCLVIPPKALSTYLIYFNSIAQALSLYALWAIYDFGGWHRWWLLLRHTTGAASSSSSAHSKSPSPRLRHPRDV